MDRLLETRLTVINPTSHRVEVICPKNEFEAIFNEELKKVQQQVEIKGFRKGKAPLPMIKQRYGQDIYHDVCYEFANKEIVDFLTKADYNTAGAPKLVDIQNDESGVTCVLEYELHTKIEIEDYSSFVVEEPVVVVEEDDIDVVVKRIANDFGDTEPSEEITDYNHMIEVKTFVFDAETNEFSEGKDESIDLSDKLYKEEFRNSFLNKKVNDEFEFAPLAVSGEESKTKFKFFIKEIEKFVPKELDEEFINELSGGRYSSIEDLREEIGLQLQDYFNYLTDKNKTINLQEVFINKFSSEPVPESLIKEYTDNYIEHLSKERKQSAEIIKKDTAQMEQAFNITKRMYIWSAIVNFIFEKEKLEFEDEDVAKLLAPYGIPAELANLEFLKKADKDGRMIQMMTDNKVLDFLSGSVSTSESKLSDDEKTYHLSAFRFRDSLQKNEHTSEYYDTYDPNDIEDYDESEEEHVHDEHCNHDH